jgi:PleD family two-component response regulator
MLLTGTGKCMADKKTILAIDDLPMALAVYNNILSGQYDVRIAASAIEALILLKTLNVDIFLVDIEMPDMSGFEFIHELRKMPKFMSTPVIVVSSHSSGDFVAHALSKGANALIAKPVKPGDLLAQVSQLLEHAPKNKLLELLSR